jgi:FKBP-type peptidyl-prolyl cis-trans isomerase (trigger factor)
MTREDYFRYTEKTEEQSMDDARENAVEHFTRVFALAKLAEEEDLEVSKEEIDERVAEIEKSDTEEAQDLKRRDLNSESVRSSIRDTLLNGKAMDRLVILAKGKADEETEDSAEVEDQEDSGPQEGDADES